MEDLEWLEVFGRFGADAVLVAAAVACGVRLLKCTLLKDRGGALFTALLPFALGVVLFAGLQCILHPSLDYLAEHIGNILYRGFTAGCLSTLFGAFLSRFTGRKTLSGKEAVVRELLTGLAAGDALDALAVEVAACVSEEYSDEDVSKVEKALRAFAEGNAAADAEEGGESAEEGGESAEEGGESAEGTQNTAEGADAGTAADLKALAELIVQTLKTAAV